MKPVDSLFDRFKRVVRDLSRQLSKDVELRTEGGDMELDRTILEAFVDPLTHMIRNSLDHGIESAEERQKAAKPHMATITLKAFQESGEIIIAVCDDGKGVDLDRVKQKAIEKNLISEQDAADLPDNKAVMLIFEPGFSTAEKLSEVSGRGVGMDVVRTNIEAIGGVLDCHTEAGKGTTIQARLPLTKAMVASSLISALIVRVGRHRLCIPQSAVNELIRVSENDRKEKIRILQGQEVFQHRELVLPIVSLSSALEESSGSDIPAGDPVENIAENVFGCSGNNTISVKDIDHNHSVKMAQTLIVLQHRKKLFGMIVDEIIGIEEAVVRELPKLVACSSVFSGHTVLGDGQVVMLVDIGGVVEKMNMKFSSKLQQKVQEQKLPALSVGKRADRQTMIIFNYSDTEFFAVPLELVTLVEKINSSDIRKVKDRCYYPFKNNTIPLLFLDRHLPVTPIPRDLDHYNLILPARVKFPIGIITNSNITVQDISEKFDSKITHDKGVLGTFMHDGNLVMLLDLYALFEHDDPDHFETPESRGCVASRILIVEDSLFYRKLNATYLSGPGRELTVVNDGREALMELRQNPYGYDLVVTDIEMPVMNGFELIKAIRGDPLLRDIPVIALTALQDQASREKGMRLDFDEYVIKVDKDSLTTCVNRYAEKAKKNPRRIDVKKHESAMLAMQEQ
jgi:two-component system chemotaxis sensor kinase CheA